MAMSLRLTIRCLRYQYLKYLPVLDYKYQRFLMPLVRLLQYQQYPPPSLLIVSRIRSTCLGSSLLEMPLNISPQPVILVNLTFPDLSLTQACKHSHLRFRFNFSKTSGIGSMQTPDQSSSFSKKKLFENVTPSWAPISTKIPFRVRLKNIL